MRGTVAKRLRKYAVENNLNYRQLKKLYKKNTANYKT